MLEFKVDELWSREKTADLRGREKYAGAYPFLHVRQHTCDRPASPELGSPHEDDVLWVHLVGCKAFSCGSRHAVSNLILNLDP